MATKLHLLTVAVGVSEFLVKGFPDREDA